METGRSILLVAAICAASAPQNLSAQSGNISRVGDFSKGTAGWRSVRIDKKTPVTIFRSKTIAGVPAIEAYAKNSMALYTKSLSINLSKTPILCWRWRVSNVVTSANIAKKSGDDQAARIYLGVDLPNSIIGLATRAKLALARSRSSNEIPDGAISYVWDNQFPVGTARNNVFTKQAKIIVAQSGGSRKNQWVNERRNLARDIQTQFKTAKGKVTSIAISSDTDNTGSTVTAAFADLHFVSANAPCRFQQ